MVVLFGGCDGVVVVMVVLFVGCDGVVVGMVVMVVMLEVIMVLIGAFNIFIFTSNKR